MNSSDKQECQPRTQFCTVWSQVICIHTAWNMQQPSSSITTAW
jgi:hypothetical protein